MKIPYFVPWINDQDRKSVLRALDSRWLTNGPILSKFETKIKQFVGTRYSAGVGSATHALHLALRSLEIGPGDEVIVPTFTFAATANAVRYCGAKPILTDVELDTFNISIKEIRKRITKKTRAIIPVHYGGQACDMAEIIALSKKHGFYVIEDCAHSLGSTYEKQKCGSIGHVGCFSFYATKIITTAEGGMVVTSNRNIINKVKLLRSQAMNIQARERELKAQWRYDVVDLGYNYRLDELRAALGLSQFDRIDTINKMRMNIAKKYNKLLQKIKGIVTPSLKPNRNHIYHLYTIKIDKDYHMTRDELFHKLHRAGIGTSVQFYPLHLMSNYKHDYVTKVSEFKNSNLLKDQVLSLPIYPKMTEKQVQYIVSLLR